MGFFFGCYNVGNRCLTEIRMGEMAVRIIVVFILSTMFLMGLDSKVSYTTDSEFYSLVLMALALAVLVVFICWWVSKKMESSTSTVWKITKGVITGVVVLFVVLFGDRKSVV